MVSPVENLTRLDGTVLARAPHPRLDGWDAVTLEVQHVEALTGPPAFAQPRGGGPLTIAVRRDLLGEAGPGSGLTARVKFTPGDLIAEAFPGPGDFSIVPAGTELGDPPAGGGTEPPDIGTGSGLPDPLRPRRADGIEGPQL